MSAIPPSYIDESWSNLLKYYTRNHGSDGKVWERLIAPNDDLHLKEDEFILSSYPKCGTNWTLQVLHQIRTGGSEDFKYLQSCFPGSMGKKWQLGETDESNENIKEFVNNYHSTDCKYKPMIYQGHLGASQALPMGGKHIVVLRKPTDALVSFYYFGPNLCNVDASKITMEDFYFAYFATLLRPNYFHFLRDWVLYREKSANIILILYEDMKENLSVVIDHLSKFMGIELDAEQKMRIEHLSSFENMSAKAAKYNSPELFNHIRKSLGVPIDEPQIPLIGILRQGKNNYKVPEKVKQHMQLMWQQIVEPATGFTNYEHFREKYTLLK